jgi:hypothetical protein
MPHTHQSNANKRTSETNEQTNKPGCGQNEPPGRMQAGSPIRQRWMWGRPGTGSIGRGSGSRSGPSTGTADADRRGESNAVRRNAVSTVQGCQPQPCTTAAHLHQRLQHSRAKRAGCHQALCSLKAVVQQLWDACTASLYRRFDLQHNTKRSQREDRAWARSGQRTDTNGHAQTHPHTA